MKYTFLEFDRQFPDNNACLNYIFNDKYGKLEICPKCNKKARFKRVYGRKSYQCLHTDCQYQIYPMVGTIFQKSPTPLLKWFRAMYLFTTTRNGVAAKEIERYCGVTYPTALRMAHRVKILMGKGEMLLLSGEVHTNTIESFWSQLKRMIKGTHIKVSHKHLQKYIDEAIFRYEHRKEANAMFEILISKITSDAA